MKKIFAFITLIISSCILYAQDEMIDLLNLVDTYNQSKELKVEVDRYIETTIFKWEVTPKFFRSNNSHRNTFTWYIWKEYEKAKGFEKINYGKQLNKISNYYK